MARILLIDDEPDLLFLYQRALENAGHTTEVLWHGSRVVEVARRFRPDLVGLDWVMPELGGEGVIRLLKAEPDTRSIPILVISALQGLDARVRLIGAEAVLRKPFRSPELLSAFDHVLAAAGRRQLESASRR